ncbi:MAG TPA: DUF4292 domain-containing protein [Flavobacteriales bacterium]|nr:DUF4292 domain-containing protein [Flavobacteriales bacterium]
MNKLLSYLFLILIFSSCSVKVREIDYAKAPKNAKDLIERVISKNKIPERLSLKGKVNLIKDEKDVTLNINIKYRKDSLIWASVSAPFGIELFRTMLTKDSMYYINRTNKTFFVKPITDITTFLKVDISFDEIQEMITANPRVLKKEYTFHIIENTFELNAKQVFYKVSADFYRILRASIIDGGNELNYEFSSFINQNEFIFPKQFSISVRSSENFEATLDYSKIVFNEKQKLPFKIPSSYVEAE